MSGIRWSINCLLAEYSQVTQEDTLYSLSFAIRRKKIVQAMLRPDYASNQGHGRRAIGLMSRLASGAHGNRVYQSNGIN